MCVLIQVGLQEDLWDMVKSLFFSLTMEVIKWILILVTVVFESNARWEKSLEPLLTSAETDKCCNISFLSVNKSFRLIVIILYKMRLVVGGYGWCKIQNSKKKTLKSGVLLL